jgi:hypothetical protein
VSLPVLGLLAGPTDSSALTPLVAALRPWCRPSALDPALGPSAAFLATATDAPGLEAALRSGTPTAVFVADGAPIPDPVHELARSFVVTTERQRNELGDRAVVLRRDAVRGSEHPPLTPFVRSRWRARFGLPDPMVVDLGGAGGSSTPDDAIPAALAVCSAAVVRGPWLLTALALGTAVVTDATSAADIGATEHVHLAVAPPATAHEIADALAREPARAAALGWGGRLLVEQRHDLDAIAERLVEDLELGPASIPAAPLARLDAELAALGTSASSPVAIRALRRAAGVAGAGDWADLTGRRR